MTDVKERVARAICRQNLISTRQPDDAKTMDHYWKSFLPEADAALSALGWAEMVEALEGYEKATKRVADNVAEFGTVTDIEFLNDLWIVGEAARTALSRARGEKT